MRVQRMENHTNFTVSKILQSNANDGVCQQIIDIEGDPLHS